MTDMRKQEDTAALVHWTYSRDEWRNFMRWKKRKMGIFYYLLHLLGSGPKPPGVTISTNSVFTGNARESFHDDNRRLKRVTIRDAGDMNILEISYQRNDLEHPGRNDIHVLIPKGSLKEAIGVEEQLNKTRTTNL